MWLAVLTIASLAACNRSEHANITGSYGEGLVTGQVTMADGLGSPAGVEISLRGTGMTTVLADDGRFTFAGVPQNAALDFRRAADGVQASLGLASDQGFVTISLSRNEARSMNRRGGKSEYEGILRTASATSLVVATSRDGNVTFALTAATVIRKGNTVLAAADLEPADRVHVKATTATDGTRIATLVIVQNTNGGDDEDGDDDAPGIREFEGIVRSASATSLVVFTSHREEVTFVITAATEIRKGNDTLTAADLKADMRVHVKAKVEATTSTATRITVQKTK
jgi:hypothetical protein